MMASATFLLQLQNYPKDTINDEMIDLLQPYFRMEDYNMDMARRVCGDVAGLLSWTKAMSFFHSVNKEVLPLKANLTLQEARLKVSVMLVRYPTTTTWAHLPCIISASLPWTIWLVPRSSCVSVRMLCRLSRISMTKQWARSSVSWMRPMCVCAR